MTVTWGTLFIPTTERPRYVEHHRAVFEVSPAATVRELIEVADEHLPPRHPGFSYLTLPEPHEALEASATLEEVGIADDVVLRLFSKVR